MKQVDLREGARRQDRAVALYASLQCWVRGLDAVVLRRHHLLRLLGLKRFKETRVEWLQEDMRELFPHQVVYVSNESKSLGALLASRRAIPANGGNLTPQLAACRAAGIQVADFELWPRPTIQSGNSTLDTMLPFFADSVNPDERFLDAYLSLLAGGQISPLSIPRICPVPTPNQALQQTPGGR